MIRSTTFVHLVPAAPPDVVDQLLEAVRRAGEELDVLAVDAAPTTANSHRAGDIMLLGAFTDHDTCERAALHPYVTSVVRPLLERCAAHLESARYTQGAVGLQEPELRDGIHRTLLLSVDPTTAPSSVEQFEHDLRGMPRYIDSIRNWSLSRVDTMHGSLGPEYTHVWEQEFATLDGLTGPYMTHGYHWSLVDPWFDAQGPGRVVHSTLIHSACALRRSVLACA